MGQPDATWEGFADRVRAEFVRRKGVRPHSTTSLGAPPVLLQPLRELFWQRWGRERGIQDPYISPHLRLLHPVELRLGALPTGR